MNKYKKNYIIKSYECDSRLRLRIRSLFNLFQDMADEHADKMGVGYHFCHERGIGWIGGGYHLKIEKLPTWGDEITIETWPSAATAATGIRDFRVSDQKGRVLINATSQWVLVDINRMRPISVVKHIPAYELAEDHALVSAFDKIKLPESSFDEMRFPVHVDEIDLNGHVNNALYPTWVSDALTEDFLNTHTIHELQISFKRPAKRGDTVRLKTYQTDEVETTHVLSNADETTEFARVRILWRV